MQSFCERDYLTKYSMCVRCVFDSLCSYDYSLAEDFITANKLSKDKSLSDSNIGVSSGESEELPHERIAALERAVAEYTKKCHDLEDALAEEKSEKNVRSEKLKLLQVVTTSTQLGQHNHRHIATCYAIRLQSVLRLPNFLIPMIRISTRRMNRNLLLFFDKSLHLA